MEKTPLKRINHIQEIIDASAAYKLRNDINTNAVKLFLGLPMNVVKEWMDNLPSFSHTHDLEVCITQGWHGLPSLLIDHYREIYRLQESEDFVRKVSASCNQDINKED